MLAFFGLDIGNGVVEWIVGDAFLKNVYTVFRQSPAAVGFALTGSGGSSTTTSTAGVKSGARVKVTANSFAGPFGAVIALGISGIFGAMMVL